MRHPGLGLAVVCLAAAWRALPAEYLDLAPFGRTTTAVENGSRATTVEWDDERDVREIRVRYAAAPAGRVQVEYWFRNWPYPPPRMPTMEDPVDDLWQGKWLTAQSSQECRSSECVYTFQPLTNRENPLAKNLPGTRYRRTLKVRLVCSADVPLVSSLQVFSESKEAPLTVRVELGRGERGVSWAGSVAVFNGLLRSAQSWGFQSGDAFEGANHWRFRAGGKPKGLTLELTASDPAPPGSQDVTIVTIKASGATAQGNSDRTFSFSTDDLKRGPIDVPAFHAYVESSAPPAGRSKRVRQMIPLEPEQTYERASREIPPLDPWKRENGGRVYLPLAADASWQKFAFEPRVCRCLRA